METEEFSEKKPGSETRRQNTGGPDVLLAQLCLWVCVALKGSQVSVQPLTE